MATVLGERNYIDGVPLGSRMSLEQFTAAREALNDFEAAIGHDSHCLVLTGPLGYRNHARTKSTEKDVLDCCYTHFDGYPAQPADVTLSVVLDSFGGSLDSAFRIAVYMRRFASRVDIYVPRWAKSAATLLTLGSDRIEMSPFAELGPLDTQIKDPRNPSKSISALDCYQSVDYVQKFALDTIPKVLGVLLLETEARLPLSDLVGMSTDFTCNEVSPVLSQVRALDFGGWGRTLRIGEMYARILQVRYGRLGEAGARELAETLVYGYTHHPFCLDFDEARRIGLNVEIMDSAAYSAAVKIAEACEGSRCVAFAEDIEQMANDVGASQDGEGLVRDGSIHVEGRSVPLATDHLDDWSDDSGDWADDSGERGAQ